MSFISTIKLQSSDTASSSVPTYTDLITTGGKLVDELQVDDNDPRLAVFSNDITIQLSWTPKMKELLYDLKPNAGAATHFFWEGTQYEIIRKRRTNRSSVEITGEVIE